MSPDQHKSLSRASAREIGINVGRYKVGRYNAITDVKGVKVGHVTHIEDEVLIPKVGGKTFVRSGVTAIWPGGQDVYNKHVVAGGFVLNGIGEMSGLTQIMEWGWIETPILLTNTMSVGIVHSGVIQYMQATHPELRDKSKVVIPVVGETDDSFLNDVRVPSVTLQDAMQAIKIAKGGRIAQGSVGAGTGMTTLDFAGGVGTSSRVLPKSEGGYTIGVFVLSNFGKMRNLTIDGAVIGRQLDNIMPKKGRRGETYGSIIVVVATDAPLLSNQLNRVAKRAALGLGRVGSHARSTSGEIVLAFSSSNRTDRLEKDSAKSLRLEYISDARINPLYEAVIEATEEAVLNAIFCSSGMTGYAGNTCPAIPHDKVLQLLKIK